MIQRKNKLKLIQLILLSIGVLALYFTYYNDVEQSKIISPQIKDNLKSLEREEDLQKGDYFYNIEYTGLDFSGNRYLLKSKKALLDEVKPEIIYMEGVSAIFYFKDDTTLYIWSEEGIYNNKNLDMEFKKMLKESI